MDNDSPRSSSLWWTLGIRSQTYKITSEKSHGEQRFDVRRLFFSTLQHLGNPELTTTFPFLPEKWWHTCLNYFGVFWKKIPVISAALKEVDFKATNFWIGSYCALDGRKPTPFTGARAVEVYLRRDNQCQSSVIKMARGCYIRPCIKVRKLPVIVE